MYREMEQKPPRRRWGYVAWRIAGHVGKAALVVGCVVGCVKGCPAALEYAVEASERSDARSARERQSKIDRCVSRGGSWNEGVINGERGEWCSGVRR